MSLVVKNAAQRHAKQAQSLIQASAHTLDIRVRATRSETSGASLFSDLAVADPDLTVIPDIKCIWHDATNLPSARDSQTMALMGRYPTCTAIVVVWLADVLVDSADVYGETYFDLASEVIHGNHVYEVLVAERSGMAVIPPYILTVALTGEVVRSA